MKVVSGGRLVDAPRDTSDAAVRHGIPATLIATGVLEADIREAIAADHPFMTELRELTAVDVVDLPTGHRPQLPKPQEFTASLVEILGR